MAEKTDWEARAANLLKAELKRKGVTYAQLVDRLAEIGIYEKEPNIRNKLSRGKFTAAFMLACFEAIGTVDLRVV
ncbi:DUF6471 domain-containing protein [Roseibium sp.]|uniref:DUF6471 domain-containing protein n=1 Tax=Roseibium sp. TaxID=1936156 RepID=UPI003A97D4A0